MEYRFRYVENQGMSLIGTFSLKNPALIEFTHAGFKEQKKCPKTPTEGWGEIPGWPSGLSEAVGGNQAVVIPLSCVASLLRFSLQKGENNLLWDDANRQGKPE